MNKTKNLKKVALLFAFGLVLAIVGTLLLRPAPAEATFEIPTPPVICHHTPGTTVTKKFDNWTAYLGHIRGGHGGPVFDTLGACPKPPECKWSEWSECSAECGGGTQSRVYGGDDECKPDREIRRCNTHACSTIRWCFPCQLESVLKTEENGIHKYCARAIPSDEEPKEGFRWKEGMDKWCEKPEPTPTPEPTTTPKQPENPTTEAGANVCHDDAPANLPANPLVWRKGDCAIVQWQPTGGDRANVYYYENQRPENAHAVRDTDNDGYVEICALGNKDWTFGVQQSGGCAGGSTVWIEDGGTIGWVLFTP